MAKREKTCNCKVCQRLDKEISRLKDLHQKCKEKEYDDNSRILNIVTTHLMILEGIKKGEKGVDL